ncbi:aldo/keto reductase [Roseibacterium sp. SDUM158017]|uniref:aldo/keto reductase n=1 Tax=Roseicyclus salinarum TaxID=3036773 RepID=UPI00241532EF|nr:aldo/keto reductase [Roseibacterium sp. SDUM158017]MDG4647615.1 aldo/keto reductase [Roseibacterium sp. SDUM158017]
MNRVKMAELTLSRIVYGMWRLGDDKDTSPAHVRAKVEACLEQGITTMDQADIYGDYGAEALLGAAFRESPGLRDRVELVSKFDIVAPVGRSAGRRLKHYDTTAAYMTEAVETSLRDMGTDRIDLFLVHRPDPLMDHEETGRALDALVASGKVRAVGVSNFRPWDWKLLQSAMGTPLVTNQIEISAMRLEAFTNGDLSFHQRHGHPVMAWSPLGGGRLFGEEGAGLRAVLTRIGQAQGVGPADVAVAFLLRHPACILPVMGTNSLERIRGLSAAMNVELDREDWFEIYSASLGHEVP